MTHSQTNAENAGSARKAFVAHVLKAVDEYVSGLLKPMGLIAEVLAAARAYRRKLGQGR